MACSQDRIKHEAISLACNLCLSLYFWWLMHHIPCQMCNLVAVTCLNIHFDAGWQICQVACAWLVVHNSDRPACVTSCHGIVAESDGVAEGKKQRGGGSNKRLQLLQEAAKRRDNYRFRDVWKAIGILKHWKAKLLLLQSIFIWIGELPDLARQYVLFVNHKSFACHWVLGVFIGCNHMSQ